MSEIPNESNFVHFAIVVDNEVTTVLSMFEENLAAIAGLSSDPKVVLIPNEIANLVVGTTPNNPWTWDGESFIPPSA